ncbi:unnamed protein product [Closterium sp. Naga37s-1]|nr:unnamed protein product [Closterium sp. Naga37s-1]
MSTERECPSDPLSADGSARAVSGEAEGADVFRVVIVGAGPAGLALANYLLARGGGRFHVSVIEKGVDPRAEVEEAAEIARRYAMGLSIRGMHCLMAIPGVMDKVQPVLVNPHEMVMPAFGRLIRFSVPKDPPQGLVSRTDLCASLLDALIDRATKGDKPATAGEGISDEDREKACAEEQKHLKKHLSKHLAVYFESRILDVDMKGHVVTASVPCSSGSGSGDSSNSGSSSSNGSTSSSSAGSSSGGSSSGGSSSGGSSNGGSSNGSDSSSAGGGTGLKNVEIKYDLLVGADGVRSYVRNLLAARTWDFPVHTDRVYHDWTVVNMPVPPSLTPSSLFFAAKVPNTKNIGAVAIPQVGGEMCLVWGWKSTDPPLDWLSLASPAAAKHYLDERLPWLDVPEEAAWKLLKQKPRTSMQVKCWRYHDSDAQVALIGDAAHSTLPSLGQGCNASITDALVLGRLLLGEAVSENDRVPRPLGKDGAAAAGCGDGGASIDLPEVEELRAGLAGTLSRYSALQKSLARCLFLCAHIHHHHPLPAVCQLPPPPPKSPPPPSPLTLPPPTHAPSPTSVPPASQIVPNPLPAETAAAGAADSRPSQAPGGGRNGDGDGEDRGE